MIISKGTSKVFLKIQLLSKIFTQDISGIKVFTGLSNIAESTGLIAYPSKESGLQCHIKDIIDCGLLFFLVSIE